MLPTLSGAKRLSIAEQNQNPESPMTFSPRHGAINMSITEHPDEEEAESIKNAQKPFKKGVKNQQSKMGQAAKRAEKTKMDTLKPVGMKEGNKETNDIEMRAKFDVSKIHTFKNLISPVDGSASRSKSPLYSHTQSQRVPDQNFTKSTSFSFDSRSLGVSPKNIGAFKKAAMDMIKDELQAPPFKRKLMKEKRDSLLQNLTNFEATNIKKIQPPNHRPLFGPIAPKQDLQQLQEKAASSPQVGSSAPVNLIEMQLKIKCSKAFQKKEQKELSEIMKRIQNIVDKRKEFDAKQRSKLEDQVIDKLQKRGSSTTRKRKQMESINEEDEEKFETAEQIKKELRDQKQYLKDKKVYEVLNIPHKEGQPLKKVRETSLTSYFHERSKSTLTTSSRQIGVTKIERMGLADPDGTRFKEELQGSKIPNIESVGVGSYKHLKSQYKDIWKKTAMKREFIREFSKQQLNPKEIAKRNAFQTQLWHQKPEHSAGAKTIDVTNYQKSAGKSQSQLGMKASDTKSIVSEMLAGERSSAKIQEADFKDYLAMVSVFDNPSKHCRGETLKNAQQEQIDLLKNQNHEFRVSRISDYHDNDDSDDPQAHSMDHNHHYDPYHGKHHHHHHHPDSESDDYSQDSSGHKEKKNKQTEESQQPNSESEEDELETMRHLTTNKLLLVQIILKDFIIEQIDLAQELQPQMIFDKTNFSGSNVYQALTLSRNTMFKNATFDKDITKIKSEKMYLKEAISALDNKSIAKLSDILLINHLGKEQNAAKRLLKKQSKASISGRTTQMENGKASYNFTFLQKLEQGLSSQMGEYDASVISALTPNLNPSSFQKLNLEQLKSQVQEGIKSQPKITANKSRIKLKIDAFQNNVKVKKKEIPHDAANSEIDSSNMDSRQNSATTHDRTNAQIPVLGSVQQMASTVQLDMSIRSPRSPNSQSYSPIKKFEFDSNKIGLMGMINERRQSINISAAPDEQRFLQKVGSILSIQKHFEPQFQIEESEAVALNTQLSRTEIDGKELSGAYIATSTDAIQTLPNQPIEGGSAFDGSVNYQNEKNTIVGSSVNLKSRLNHSKSKSKSPDASKSKISLLKSPNQALSPRKSNLALSPGLLSKKSVALAKQRTNSKESELNDLKVSPKQLSSVSKPHESSKNQPLALVQNYSINQSAVARAEGESHIHFTQDTHSHLNKDISKSNASTKHHMPPRQKRISAFAKRKQTMQQLMIEAVSQYKENSVSPEHSQLADEQSNLHQLSVTSEGRSLSKHGEAFNPLFKAFQSSLLQVNKKQPVVEEEIVLSNLRLKTILNVPEHPTNPINSQINIEELLKSQGEILTKHDNDLFEIRRRITPIFTGSTGDIIKDNISEIQRLFGVKHESEDHNKTSRSVEEKEFWERYYSKVIHYFQSNNAMQDEIIRQVYQPKFRKRKPGESLGTQLINMLKTQFNSGIYHLMHANFEMLIRIMNDNPDLKFGREFKQRIQNKQNPLLMKSPFIKKQDEQKISEDAQIMIPILIKKIAGLEGEIPESRQQHGLAFAQGKLWVFGGKRDDQLNDLKRLDFKTKKWSDESEVKSIMKKVSPDFDKGPEPRYGQTFLSFANRYLIVYGGGASISDELFDSHKKTFGDLWIYDIFDSRKKWIPIRNFLDQQSPTSEDKDMQIESEEHVDQVIRQHFRASAYFLQYQVMESPRRRSEIPGVPAPISRMNHASTLFGGCLLVHGGFTSTSGSILNDLACFDISFGKWIRMKQTKDNKKEMPLGYRKNHTMTTVFEPLVPLEYRNTRAMWIMTSKMIVNNIYSQSATSEAGMQGLDNMSSVSLEPSNSNQKKRPESQVNQKKVPVPLYGQAQGIYIFGGLNEKKKPTNDLFFIQPNYKKNQKYLTLNTASYKKSLIEKGASICFTVTKFKKDEIEGQAPCPRHSHCATFFNNYLVIHGGNIGLNDLHLLSITSKVWVSVAIYNDLPTSRWCHQIVNKAIEPSDTQELLLFGGVNVNNYCTSNVFKFSFNERHVIKFVENGEKLVDSLKDQRTKIASMGKI